MNPPWWRRLWLWLVETPEFSAAYTRQLRSRADGTSQPSPATLRQLLRRDE